MAEPPFDLARAHRWFGVEFNNRAWELVEKEGRSAVEVEEMLHAAHAAAIHWQQVGAPINGQRAEVLLATAYAAVGRWDTALRHAQKALVLSETTAADGSEHAFDRASTLAIAARAHQALGDALEGERLLALALRTADALPADDRIVFDKLYVRQ